MDHTEFSSKNASPFLILIGLSGAGRSFALKTLEDMGYDTVDNLPFFLWESLLLKEVAFSSPLAIGVSVKTPAFNTTQLLKNIERAKLAHATRPFLIFIDCQEETLCRRYSETRRPHPFAEGKRPLKEALHLERRLLAAVREKSDLIIDTSFLKPAEFRKMLSHHFGFKEKNPLSIIVTSFAYRHGLPRDADIVIDVRALHNPYYIDALKHLTGLEEEVQMYIKNDPLFSPLSQTIQHLIHLTLNRCEQENHQYLTIAFGCTGGYHRSVFMTEHIGKWLKKMGKNVEIKHADIGKN
jgi:UPF0042 nucleotide-binding protein